MIPAYYLELLVVLLGLILLLADAFLQGRDKKWLGIAGVIGLSGIFILNFYARGGEGGFWMYYTYGDGSFAGFYKGLVILATVISLLMSRDYLPVLRGSTAEHHAAGEFFVLPLFACAGMMWAASAVDLVTIFVSIELITVSFYVLVAFMRRDSGSLEAGVKYLILGALSTGFMVYGIAWIIGMTGATDLAAVSRAVQQSGANEAGLLLGFALFLVSLGFKVGAFPFSLWIPDVYQGSPTPAAALLSTGSKAAGFIVLLRVLEPFMKTEVLGNQVVQVITLVSVATLLFGSLVAIFQTDFKRLLAYSSISQAGFLLLAIGCSPLMRTPSSSMPPAAVVSFYLASYLMMASLAFFVVVLVRRDLGGEDLKAYRGLGKRSPFLAFMLLVAMVSLAGIPLTAGFFSKFFVFQLAVAAKAWWPLGVAALATACGLYYYLKIVRVMYFVEPDTGLTSEIRLSVLNKAVMTLLAVGIIAFGVNPRPLLAPSHAGGPGKASLHSELAIPRAGLVKQQHIPQRPGA